jgi:uncharacterized protein YejL (UPF0352 family)
MFSGIGAAIGGFIGAGDLEDRFNEAIAELQKFKATTDVSLKGFREKGQTAFDRGISELTSPTMAPDVAALRQMLVTQISSGLSPFAQLQMEDANRFLENRAISTGNLRSGAIGLQRAELGRRVVADEFGRALQTMESLGKRDLTASGMFLNTSLGFGQNENAALQTMGNAVSSLTGAIVGKGAAQQQASAMLGAGIGGMFDVGTAAFTGGKSSVLDMMKSYGMK